MIRNSNRRDFLKQGSALGAGFFIAQSAAPAHAWVSPNDTVQVGAIGVGGRGAGDIGGVVGAGAKIVALCDVDRRSLDKQSKKFPEAKRFADFRKMLEKMDKQIDAVTVATADNTHAVASAMAMKMGKHCYTEKPMTHDVWEARQLASIAREKKVATQMGNQGTAGGNLRKSAEWVLSGALGEVKECHIWTNRPIWPQAPRIKARPKKQENVPEWLDWDLWLGPAQERPYSSAYHPFKWRGWWDFGTGALGDMACHTANLPFMALKLGAPKWVSAESDEPNPETCPGWAVVKYEFPSRGDMPPVTVYWYEGKKPDGNRVTPPLDLLQGEKFSGSGSLIVGSKGTMLSQDDYGGRSKWLPLEKFKDYKGPEPMIPRSPGHHKEYIRACQGGPAAMSNFPDYAGPLTEFVLLGNVAIRAQKKFEWDAEACQARDCPEANKYVRREYREGWTL